MNQSLLSSPAFVQTPVVHVQIGEYTFGVFKKDSKGYRQYPNYIQSLEVTKINGQVNTYSLVINYPITEDSDPNYFEKVFSSVSKSRTIEFTYGDAAASSFLYKKETAIITRVKANFQLESSSIVYTVSAVSQLSLGLSGGYSFPASTKKPSDEIFRILEDPFYGLQDLFVGMRNITKVKSAGLIPQGDVATSIEKKDNISVIAYLEYLVSLMSPTAGNAASGSFYILTFVDDPTGDFDGSYFKIVEVDCNVEHPEAYQIDIGYPGSNYVFNFNVDNDENYAIYYDYQNKLHPQEYVSRINENGEYEEVYAPMISSANAKHSTDISDTTWWTKVTQYPIKASVTIKGLLRPAILMTYVRLNIVLFGKKHINSGLYIITKQVDKVDGSGYQTVLNMTKVAGD